MRKNYLEIRASLEKLTTEASLIIQRNYLAENLGNIDKGGVDFATNADIEVDSLIEKTLREEFPESDILTEETAPKDYSNFKDSESLWVVDPIDGTTNFSRGHPNFAISIALVNKGKTEIGFIKNPLTGDTYWTNIGEERAFLNDKPIQVSKLNDFGKLLIALDWPYDMEKRKIVYGWMGQLYTKVRQIKCLGSAVSDLGSLAAGRLDGYLNAGLKPWDSAAASLLVEKAGGKITTPSGGEWNVFEPDIVATNGLIHQEILNLIKN